jgi:ectoine hydroxylase-related dioxygenase (phytanoyl-CoA dioxygenase family)
MIRPALIDRQQEGILLKDGCVVLDFLDQDELASVRQGVRRLGFGEDDDTGFPIPRSRLRISVSRATAEKKSEIFDELSPVLQRAADRFLREYTLLRIGIFDKLPRGAGIEVHQHTSIVDESRHRSLTIWLPLTDTSVEMGTLHVVKGSHEFTNHVRAKNQGRDAFGRVSMRVMARHSTPVALRARQAVLFDDRLLHWSPPNRSPLIRTALQLALVPEEAELVVYFRTSAHELVKCVVDRKTYRENWLNQESPEKFEQIEKVRQPVVTYGTRQFESMIRGERSAEPPQPEPFLSKTFNGIRDRLGY